MIKNYLLGSLTYLTLKRKQLEPRSISSLSSVLTVDNSDDSDVHSLWMVCGQFMVEVFVYLCMLSFGSILE